MYVVCRRLSGVCVCACVREDVSGVRVVWALFGRSCVCVWVVRRVVHVAYAWCAACCVVCGLRVCVACMCGVCVETCRVCGV